MIITFAGGVLQANRIAEYGKHHHKSAPIFKLIKEGRKEKENYPRK